MIKHIMLDGTVRTSIEGVEVPKGHRVYEILERIREKSEKPKKA